MTHPSSPAGYSCSNSTRPFSTWSPSPYTKSSDTSDSTPNASQPSSSETSNTPLGGQVEPYRGYDQFDGVSYLEICSASSAYPQNVSSTTLFCGIPWYGLSNRPNNEAERTHGSFTTSSQARQPGHGNVGMEFYFPKLENVRGSMEYQDSYGVVSHASLNDSQAGNGLGSFVEKEEDTTVGLSVNLLDARLPYQAKECQCNRSGGPDFGDEPIQCKMPQCRTKQRFKNKQSFESHMRNVHVVKIFRCSIDNCPRPGPFSNKHDLKRHITTTHKKEKPYRCLRPNCRARAKEFSRKDKLKDHDRKHHAEFKCWFCSQDPRFERWFELEHELWDHTHEEHPGLYSQGQQRSSHAPLSPNDANYGCL